MTSARDLIEAQHRTIAAHQHKLSARMRRITAQAMAQTRRRIDEMAPGSWGEASARATLVTLARGFADMHGGHVTGLTAGVAGVTKASQQHAAAYLHALDQHYTGVARPLAFDTLGWWETTNAKIGQVRLRQYSQSLQLYGAASVRQIEDELAKTVLLGETWDVARSKVHQVVKGVVGDREWMVDRIVNTEVSAAYNGTQLEALLSEHSDADPMLKKLVAVFDARTGRDSMALHGQTRKVDEPFFDPYFGVTYMAPPNRPHDREVVVGWRTSYGDPGAFDRSTRVWHGPGDPPDWYQGPALVIPKRPTAIPKFDPVSTLARFSGQGILQQRLNLAGANLDLAVKAHRSAKVNLAAVAGTEAEAAAARQVETTLSNVKALRREIAEINRLSLAQESAEHIKLAKGTRPAVVKRAGQIKRGDVVRVCHSACWEGVVAEVFEQDGKVWVKLLDGQIKEVGDPKGKLTAWSKSKVPPKPKAPSGHGVDPPEVGLTPAGLQAQTTNKWLWTTANDPPDLVALKLEVAEKIGELQTKLATGAIDKVAFDKAKKSLHTKTWNAKKKAGVGDPPKPKAPPPDAGAAKPTLPSPATVDVDQPGWERIGEQTGSNDGALYRAPDGSRWYVKSPANAEAARNEVLASQLYRALGVDVPEVTLGVRKGKVAVASRIVDGVSKAQAKLVAGAVDGVGEGFAADCWLANWDVVGLNYDNMLVKGGKALRLDTGGALRFRAQGGLKGAEWGDEVHELATLRDATKNAQAASVFKHVTDEQVAKGIDRIVALDEKVIRALVDRFGPLEAAEREALTKRLLARREHLRQMRQGFAPSKPLSVGEVYAPPPPISEGTKGWSFVERKSADHARNEALASELYRMAGVDVVDVSLVEGQAKHVAERVIDGIGPATATTAGVREGIVVDAWLANWTVADHMTAAGGKAYRRGLKGALRYRGGGEAKGSAFGDAVTELETFRSSKNPKAAQLFSETTAEDIVAGIDRVAAISDSQIAQIVEALGPGDKVDRASLTQKLVRRRDDLKRQRATWVARIEEERAAAEARRLALEQAQRAAKRQLDEIERHWGEIAKSGRDKYMEVEAYEAARHSATQQAQAYQLMSESQRERFDRALRFEAEVGADARGLTQPIGPEVTAGKGKKAANATRKSEMDKWAHALDYEDRSALRGWSGSDFRAMRALDSGRDFDMYFRDFNGKLNVEAIVRYREMNARVRRAMRSSPNYVGEAMRGMNLDTSKPLYQSLVEGNEYTLEAMSSHTISKAVAARFAGDSPGSVILRVNRTTRGMSIDHSLTSSFAGSEAEVMIDKGVRYRVVKVSPDPGARHRKIVELEEIEPSIGASKAPRAPAPEPPPAPATMSVGPDATPTINATTVAADSLKSSTKWLAPEPGDTDAVAALKQSFLHSLAEKQLTLDDAAFAKAKKSAHSSIWKAKKKAASGEALPDTFVPKGIAKPAHVPMPEPLPPPPPPPPAPTIPKGKYAWLDVSSGEGEALIKAKEEAAAKMVALEADLSSGAIDKATFDKKKKSIHAKVWKAKKDDDASPY